MTIKELKKDLADFTDRAKKAVQAESDEVAAERAVQSIWKELFHGMLDAESAKGFVAHFQEGKRSKATRRRNRQRGGMAPIAYQMGPGLPSATLYATVPTDVSTDPASLRSLDATVPKIGMLQTAGTETWRFPTVPATMGSNQVGGRRRRTRRSKQKGGGSLLETIGHMPFQAMAPPSMIQTGYAMYSGQPSAPSSDPTNPAWSFSSNGSIVDPGMITKIGSDINRLVTPTPWK
jgi:hypothetical protein